MCIFYFCANNDGTFQLKRRAEEEAQAEQNHNKTQIPKTVGGSSNAAAERAAFKARQKAGEKRKREANQEFKGECIFLVQFQFLHSLFTGFARKGAKKG